jgi:hypothetical protein
MRQFTCMEEGICMRVMQRLSAVFVVVAAGLTCSDDDGVSPRFTELFTTPAGLAGAAERPTPVTSGASGDFIAEVRDTATIGGKKDSLAVIRFELVVGNINGATGAHIHAGGPDVAGPVMVFLFNGPTTGSGFSGILASAEITRASAFNGAFNMDSVLTRMRNGTAYVNVHTSANPGGEIRGQIQRN